DELFSDAFDLKEVGGSYEIDCAMVQVKQGADVDIGANASAEEASEDLEDGVEIVNNVVYSFRLQSTSFDKKSYTTYIKGYLKGLKAKLNLNEEDAKKFEAEITPEVKKILGNFKDYEFYLGESMDVDGGLMYLNYREDGVTPFFTVFKHSVKTMKV
ncbi:Ribosome associating protein, partial [Lunasporangiospora selenospora]